MYMVHSSTAFDAGNAIELPKIATIAGHKANLDTCAWKSASPRVLLQASRLLQAAAATCAKMLTTDGVGSWSLAGTQRSATHSTWRQAACVRLCASAPCLALAVVRPQQTCHRPLPPQQWKYDPAKITQRLQQPRASVKH